MGRTNKPVDLKSVLRHSQRRSTPSGGAETRLDSLLETHAQLQDAAAESQEPQPAPNPLDNLRATFVSEMIPAFEEIREKYAGKGLRLEMDASNFLGGGRNISIVIEFGGGGVRIDGTAMPNLIAFQKTRYSQSDPSGLTASGPTLRARSLTGGGFRDFICDQIALLVQSVIAKKP